jgi:Ras-related protein Rab-6A
MSIPSSFVEPLTTKYKIVVLGDEGVGKTAILKRFTDDKYDSQYTATVGSDLVSKTLRYERSSAVMRLQVWDTAGQEQFRSLLPSHIRDSAAAVIVYDVTNRASFDHTNRWISQVRAERGAQDDDGGDDECVIWLIANKAEFPQNQRVVSLEEGLERAANNNLFFLEVSARAGYNITHFFRRLALSLIKYPQTTLPSTRDDSSSHHASSKRAAPDQDASSSSWSSIFR